MISVVKREVGRLTMHITLEAPVSSHFIHNLNPQRISSPQQMGSTTLNGGLEERAWSSLSFKTVSFPGPFLPAHFPLGDGIHGALSRPFAVLRPCSLLVETHPIMAPASQHLPMWSDLHLQLCHDVTWNASLECSTSKSNSHHQIQITSSPNLLLPLTLGLAAPSTQRPRSHFLPLPLPLIPGLIDLTHLCPFSPSLLS